VSKRKAAPPAPASANPERGERVLELGGATYVLRPSHEAIVAVEERLGKSNLALLRLGNSGDLTNVQLAAIAAGFIRAGAKDDLGRAVNETKLGKAIYERGAAAVTTVLTLCLLDAVQGGRSAEGNGKAPAANNQEAAGDV